MPTLLERYRGAILGLAAGDAVGTTLEFKKPGTFEPITDMVGGGPFKLEPGQWTDDTSMMLCLGTSMVDCRKFDPEDQMKRYVKWFDDGYMSSNGKCFDVGNTVYNALMKFKETGDPYSGPLTPDTAGNGSLMRLAPVPLAYAKRPGSALRYAKMSSDTTHGAWIPVDACMYLAALILAALDSVEKKDLFKFETLCRDEYWTSYTFCPEILEVARGSFLRKEPPEIQGSGYAAESLEAALWSFATTNTFEEGCLRAANLGRDADTTAAIYGQLAGAYYGVEAIPLRWREKLAFVDDLEILAENLYSLAQDL